MTLKARRAGVVLLADGTWIEDGAVTWEGDAIVSVGPWRALRRAVPGLDADGGRDDVIIPGLVNAHQHGQGLGFLAGGVPDQPLEDWLAEAFGLPVIGDRDGVLLAAARLLRSGVTTTVHLHAARSPSDPARLRARLAAYRESGLSVAFAVGAKSRRRLALVEDDEFLGGLVPALRGELEAALGEAPALDYFPARELVAEIERLVDGLPAGDDRVRILVGPPGIPWCTEDSLVALADLARRRGLGCQVHVLESALQRRLAGQEAEGPVARLDRLGLLGPSTSLVHVVHPLDGDLERIAASGASVVLNPGSNLRLGHGISPVAPMRALGIPLAVGTDSVGLSDADDLFEEMRLVRALSALPPDGAGSRMTAAACLAVMTGNGARVAGMPRAGRLEPGARADFVVLDGPGLWDPAPEPVGDPAEIILGRADPARVRTVVAAGVEMLRDSVVTTFDEGEARGRASEAIGRWLRDAGPARRALAARLRDAVRAAHSRRPASGS